MIHIIQYIFCVIILSSMLSIANAVRCYECATGQDPKGEDNCGAYAPFEKDKNIPVECNSDESHTSGSFCMKAVQQGPIGFIWDGRPREVIRRCASVADIGVTGVCNWGIYENGYYWEECYCSEDGCNSSNQFKPKEIITFTCAFLSVLISGLYMFR